MSFLDSRLRPFGLSFEKTLKDLITGIRSNNSNPEDLQNFLTKAVQECKEEVKSTDMTKKSNAILKLSYLEMYGFDISWSSFYVLEVMSSNNFQQKRVGYLAAQQVFHSDPNILMLATNCLKKDLNSMHTVEVGIALNGISSIVTPSLARDISKDLVRMLRHGKSYIRKKAVASLFKLFLQYPEALRDDFQIFIEKLHDEDSSVVSVVVTVICELSKLNPEPFMPLLPLFYDMLLDIKNNWITIRFLKLFTTFSKREPKLRKKLLPKILELISKTDAKSLIYESINCIVRGRMLEHTDYDVAAQILKPLASFCDSRDPNLRYVSCVLFYEIGKTNHGFISNFDQLIFKLLVDVDISIRSKAVELLESVIDDGNIVEATGILLKQVVMDEEKLNSRMSGKEERVEIPNFYKIKVMQILLHLFQKNDYENISMFEWYIAVLQDIANIATSVDLGRDCDLGAKIGEHFRNIAVKVPDMRGQVTMALVKIISTDSMFTSIPHILSDTFWCLGEYSSVISNCDDLIDLLINNKRALLVNLPGDVLKNIFPCLMKLFNNWINSDLHETAEVATISDVCRKLNEFFELFIQSSEIEIQERSVEQLEFFKILQEALNLSNGDEEQEQELPMLATSILPSFFDSWEIQPVQQGQQKKLQNRIDLSWLEEESFLSDEMKKDLDALIDDELVSDEDDVEEDDFDLSKPQDYDQYDSSDEEGFTENKILGIPNEEYRRLKEEQKRERMDNPFYLDEEDSNSNLQPADLNFDSSNSAKNNETSTIDIKVQGIFQNAGAKKTKKAKKAKMKIISDSKLDLDDMDESTSKKSGNKVAFPTKGQLRAGDGKIDLSFKNKLKGFDFSKSSVSTPLLDDDENGSTTHKEDIDLNQLREDFDAGTKLVDDGDDAEEEIIVVKKKKKKSAKKGEDGDATKTKKEKKKKKKKTKNSSKEQLVEINDESE
ncbi:hypothetical protein ACO0RG_003268 [Hanseniaspora osmophila]